MKTKFLIIVAIITIISSMFFNINVVQANYTSDNDTSDIGHVIKSGDNFLEAGKKENSVIDEAKLQDASKTIYNILLLIGICVAVIISAILGLQFIIGSAEEKAKISEALIPFVIGCMVVFGAFGIWAIFINIGNDLLK